MRNLLALPLLALVPLATDAQEPPTFGAEVGLVQIEVRATDGEGQPVTDLTREDFVLEEEGETQHIEAFQFVAGPRAEATHVMVSEPGASPVAPRPKGADQQPTWLYIAPEVQRPVEFARVAGPLRSFIEGLPEGFLVSLAGLPFTDNRALLLATLDRMVHDPLASGTAVVDPLLDQQDDLAFEREVFAALQRQNGVLTSFVGMHRDPPKAPDPRDMSSLVSVERIDRQLIFYGELALLRYLDLIERMAAFPGKKMILLCRSGLNIEGAHTELLDQIAATALRHRVSIFTLDSRGLEATVPVEDRRVSNPWASSRRSRTPEPLGLPVARNQGVNGLVTLARATGGRSVVDSNDASAILQEVLDESADYYVLGYAPRDPRESGRFRKLRVSVSRPGVELRAPRGYYERKPYADQSSQERSAAAYRALLSESLADLPVKASVSFFAAPEGRTAMVFSAGVRPGDLAAKKGQKPQLEATVLVRVRNQLFESMPVILEQELSPDVRREFLETAAADATLYLTYNGRVDLPPGHYSVKVLFRDDRSGRMGTFESSVEAPDLSGSSVPSSLLLTRQATPHDPSSKEDAEPGAGTRPGDLLVVGDLRLSPEPVRTVRPGHVVYCAYHLYNATDEDFAVAEEQGMQMGLLRGQEWVGADEVNAGGQALPDREAGIIRYVGWVDTEKLPPGRYTVLAVLPNYQSRQVPELTGEFELLP
ncbi:MAG: VWA domain-containing protein [Acidobacteria bacterium]|nr:VWA domain-containing protein [Acidobacteriota bacterium]